MDWSGGAGWSYATRPNLEPDVLSAHEYSGSMSASNMLLQRGWQLLPFEWTTPDSQKCPISLKMISSEIGRFHCNVRTLEGVMFLHMSTCPSFDQNSLLNLKVWNGRLYHPCQFSRVSDTDDQNRDCWRVPALASSTVLNCSRRTSGQTRTFCTSDKISNCTHNY